MPRKISANPDAPLLWIHSTRLHLVLYSFLLVATPFILLQNFLVELISEISGSTIELGGREITVLPYLAGILFIIFLVLIRARITKLRILGGVIVMFLNMLSQEVSDYYFDHNFYDLQQNWHYIAYGIFAYMMYRDLNPRSISMPRYILITFIAALLFSGFDETFQKFLSNRIFDVGDIAKDGWGCLMGIVFIYFATGYSDTIKNDIKNIRHKNILTYFENSFSVIIMIFVFNLFLIAYGGLLTEFEYFVIVVMLTLTSFVIFFAIFHFSQYKPVKYILLTILVASLAVQSFFFIKFRSENIVYNKYGLTVYKGIPFPFFDIMIFPDGTFRPVDKKHYFNARDRKFILKQEPHILIIGTGRFGKGGRGFRPGISNFIYNHFTHKGTQVIILKTPEACEVFNRLKKENKKVLFILHNTC